ncbi:potassium transport protein 1 [Bipolaris maydis]|nr:potassium transport protein 1 [Bipolaris maydis]KAJ6199713.1 potassium transport protein 1 [Bipolaris maydis]KAJ6205685.1 potassium transport protein 1 [Bipolaris maydis]
MWKPPINFITLHYAYILSFGILAMIIVYPYGNMRAIDAYYFGVWFYITPIITNLGFINIVVVIVRLRWFKQKLKGIPAAHKRPKSSRHSVDPRIQVLADVSEKRDLEGGPPAGSVSKMKPEVSGNQQKDETPNNNHITFAPDPRYTVNEKGTLHVAGPREGESDEDDDQIKPVGEFNNRLRRRLSETRSISKATSIDRAVSSIFVLGSTPSGRRSEEKSRQPSIDLTSLSPEELGGVEYRALRVLLKVVVGYFFGLQLFGVICLIPWIHLAPLKYKEYLASQGVDKTWWAIYSSQTMINNLGLALTPDSMISFRDATWPMLIMSFLAFAGNTFYPCFLRLVIWIIWKISPNDSSTKESSRFLLDHPRRCYTLLFPSTATWILAAILIFLNFVDTLLIVTLDLDNTEVNVLPAGPRILAALFQSASSRHTGTATFNLANVNPGVQFSLLVMMYISVYPIAIGIRMSESYEDKSVGLYAADESPDDNTDSKTYLLNHLRNQLSFDLWYIFMGVFCICCSESKRIMSREDWAFSVFSIFFEVVSAYGNVGLSLGYPTNLASLSGQFSVFGKLVICAMMLRGRHRGLPYALDRAINLPNDLVTEDEQERYRDFDTQGTITNDGTDRKEEEKFEKGKRLMKSLTQQFN